MPKHSVKKVKRHPNARTPKAERQKFNVKPAPFGNKYALGCTTSGAPTKYRPDQVKMVQILCRLGATDWEIAEALEVSFPTVRHWKVRYPEFLKACQIGRDEADDRVEHSVFTRAVGYDYTAVKMHVIDGEVVQTPYHEHIPPDPGSCMFWLKNRRPANWNDSRDVNVRSTVTVSYRDLTGLPLDELQREYSDAVVTVEEVQQIAPPESSRT